MAAADLPYRPCVGIMVVNLQGLVFVGQRRNMTTPAWQMPQGGIDPGESPAQAAERELREETGIKRAEILAESRRWHSYDLPDHLIGKVWGGAFRGQTQKWLLLQFSGDDAEIDLGGEEGEFASWRWLPPAQLPQLIVPFKRPIYEAVLAEFAPLIEDLAIN
ncbi:MAG TPA: RNA pyrophosphohydrolase [Alphaproteobacteria bacterium]|jgi:putative (di)nucleoside polyphosphate hydrolase|nr:RNA pyrophosphohydrolase [Alphaproteobacteria bacterium]